MGRLIPGLLFEEKNLKAESPSWSLWPPVVWLLEGETRDLPRDMEDWDKVWQSLHRSRQSSIWEKGPLESDGMPENRGLPGMSDLGLPIIEDVP